MARKRKPKSRYHSDANRDGVTLTKRGHSWRARVWDRGKGRYRSVTRPSEKEAQEAGETLQAKFRLGTDNAEPCLLDEVWKRYKTERLDDGKAKPRTVEAMQRIVDGLREAGATNFKAAGFRTAVTRFFHDLTLSRSKAKDGRVAVSTRNRMLAQVRALLNFTRDAGWLPSDPLAGFRVTGTREQEDTTREVFHLDEARRLVRLNRTSDPVWVHALLCLYAGLRDMEARAVTWADYEADRRLLWIQKGKGNKRRAVAVQAELADILAEVSAAMGPTAKVACLPAAAIARPVTGRGLASYGMFLRLLKKEAKITRERGLDSISGMPRRLTRHALRHTYCAAMLATGEPGDNLRIMMGHGQEDLTTHYGAQVATYKAEVEDEGWERGRLHFRAPPEKSVAKAIRKFGQRPD